MTKHFRGGTRPPTTPKGTLTLLAKAQTAKVDEQHLNNLEGPTAPFPTEQAPAQEASTEVAATPAAPTEATPAPAAPKTDLYALGKKYSPKTDRNSETWGKLTKALSEGPKTMKELSELVKGHGDFLGYMTRGGHIIPHVPAKESAVS